jgi:hypothetical protein
MNSGEAKFVLSWAYSLMVLPFGTGNGGPDNSATGPRNVGHLYIVMVSSFVYFGTKFCIIWILFFCGSIVLLDPARLTYRRFLELFRHMVGLLGRVISPSQGLYLHRTTQHRKTQTNIHALSGSRTHDPSNQPAKTHASDRTATMTGIIWILRSVIQLFLWSLRDWRPHR